MMRFVCAAAICAGAYMLGQTYVGCVREAIQTIESFRALAHHLVSAVQFSGTGVKKALLTVRQGGAARFSQELGASDDLLAAFAAFRPRGKTEAACVRFMEESIGLAAKSSDGAEVAGAFAHAEQELLLFKQQTEEATNGKRKTAPRAALAVGLFLAIIVI